MPSIDPRQLNDLASFAARGGLGKGIASTDCVAEQPDQLMFIKGDELVLLRELDHCILASCEGVVGWVKKGEVEFRHVASGSSPSSPRSSSDNGPTRDDLPRTILTAPSPPPANDALPTVDSNGLDAPTGNKDLKRVSGPFDFESPQQSPNIDQTEKGFFDQQAPPEDKRESVTSIASSEALGGIGGFMMGESSSEGDEEDGDAIEEINDVSPATASLETPHSPPHSPSPKAPASDTRGRTASPEGDGNDSDWDIYGDYARESMYGPKRISLAAKRASKLPKSYRESTDSLEGFGAVHAARAALEGSRSPLSPGPKTKPSPLDLSTDPETPKAESRSPIASPHEPSFSGRSIATQLRLRIQKEREKEAVPVPIQSEGPHSPSADDAHSNNVQSNTAVDDKSHTADPPARPPRREVTETITQAVESESHASTDDAKSAVEEGKTQASLDDHPFSAADAVSSSLEAPPTLMASPMPFDDSPRMAEALEVPSPVLPDGPLSPSFTQPPPPGWSPNLAAPQPAWTPGSPASPHSIAATRQAVDVVKKTPEGKRPRGLTLVGRMDLDLSAAKGPVPITFLVGGPEVPGMSPSAGTGSTLPSMGLGLPSRSGRKSPVTPDAGLRSPLDASMPPLPNDIQALRAAPSRFPQRSVTSPITAEDSTAGPRPGFLAARPRSRSFSASVSKAIGAKEKPLTINTTPPMPSLPSPASTKKSFFGRSSKTSAPSSPKQSGRSSSTTMRTLHANSSTPSLMPDSARASSFSFSSSKGTKTPRGRVLPSPVSHKDFEDTINAGGMDFELVQPKRNGSVPQSPVSAMSEEVDSMTIKSSSSMSKILPETDEWGFVKDRSTVPEIFMSRSAPGEHRTAEQKWLGVIAAPVPAGGPPKKVRKLAVENGIPSSLRGRVWAWFMTPSLSARQAGLYEELCSHERPTAADDQIDRDVASLWSDHSIFYNAQTPGRADLRSLLRASSNFAPSGYSTPMCHIAGTLLIHCVAEDAFWLLSGLVNTALKEYYIKDGPGMKIDAGVFDGVLRGSEKELFGVLKGARVYAIDYIDKWFKQLFIRCLPWPTTLRVLDAVVSEGPRFLFVAALTILTLSRERILALPRDKNSILGYLHDLPQDSLLLPEHFMRACEKVRFREEDYKRLRGAVEREMGIA